ncbi:MAG: hypothetical protein IJX13_07110 [Clostridia bacterium]|nr:hypothetical protein [Clostridia bacterium]
MEEKTTGVEIRVNDLWLILKRCWWLMLAVLVVVFAVVYLFITGNHEDEYTATATVWAMNMPGTGGVATSDVSIGTSLINDYKQLITTQGVLEEVIEKESLAALSPAKLASMISISHQTNTRVMYVSVTSASPQSAQKIVNSLVDVFCDRLNAKHNGPDEDAKDLVTVWDEAEEPIVPSNRVSILQIALIAFVCALAVYGVYFVLYLMDDKINTAEDVEKYLGVSMLGVIPNRQDATRRGRRGGYYGYSEGTRKGVNTNSNGRNV